MSVSAGPNSTCDKHAPVPSAVCTPVRSTAVPVLCKESELAANQLVPKPQRMQAALTSEYLS